MFEPWTRSWKLRDFGVAGNIQNIADMRSNLMRDNSLMLPAEPAGAGRAAEYSYNHGAELVLHNLFSSTLGRQNAVSVVSHLFGYRGEELRDELNKLNDAERQEIHARASEINPQRYTIGLLTVSLDSLGPQWVSRDLGSPTIIYIASTPEGIFPVYHLDETVPSKDLLDHVQSLVTFTKVKSVSLFNLTAVFAEFDASLARMTKWSGGSVNIETD